MPPESIMLLRSAYEIAKRNGQETNWEAFRNSVQKELLRQSGLPEDTTDKQLILRATCTPRTYREIVDE